MKRQLLGFMFLVILTVSCTANAGEAATVIPTRPVEAVGVSEELATVTATAPTATTPTRPTPTTEPTVPATAITQPTATIQAEGALPAHTLWLASYKNGHQWLEPIDPATAQSIPGYAPIDLGDYIGGYAFSPDGRTLAILSYEGQLHLVDLVNWQDLDTGLRFADTQAITFLPDGAHIALTYDWREPKLALVDVTHQSVIAETTVPFTPHHLFIPPSGESIVAYGVALPSSPTVSEDVGPAHTAVFNTSDLSLAWEVTLPEVLDGMICSPSCGNWDHPPLIWLPAVLMSPDGRTLHIVHADSDTLTNIDLETQQVMSMPISPEQTWLEKLLALTAGVVHAKGGNETVRTAAISPDGSRLYISGFHRDATEEVDGERVYTDDMIWEPLPLQIVSATNGTILGQSDLWGSQLRLLSTTQSPQGDLLFLQAWRTNETETGTDYWTDVVNAADMSLVAHLDGYEVQPSPMGDGRSVWPAIRWMNNGVELALIDSASFNIQATQEMRDGWWLLPQP